VAHALHYRIVYARVPSSLSSDESGHAAILHAASLHRGGLRQH